MIKIYTIQYLFYLFTLEVHAKWNCTFSTNPPNVKTSDFCLAELCIINLTSKVKIARLAKKVVGDGISNR